MTLTMTTQLTSLCIVLCLFVSKHSIMMSTNNSRMGGSRGFLQSGPAWEATTKGYEKDIFYFGKGMDKKYLTSSAQLEHYIGDHYGTSALAFTLRNIKKV